MQHTHMTKEEYFSLPSIKEEDEWTSKKKNEYESDPKKLIDFLSYKIPHIFRGSSESELPMIMEFRKFDDYTEIGSVNITLKEVLFIDKSEEE